MDERNFVGMLAANCAMGRYVCVGLDSQLRSLPPSVLQAGSALKRSGHPQYMFNCAIVEATADLAGAFKLNLHYYLSQGPAGYQALIDTVAYIRSMVARVPVILDYKTGDIGSTNIEIAQTAFDIVGADAATFHTYTGMEAMRPILEREDKGVIPLARTSNPGAGEFQDINIAVQGATIGPQWQVIAAQVRDAWDIYGNCGLVFGATYPQELAEGRRMVGNMPLLIPGIGAQGGDIAATVRAGIDVPGRPATINSSRGIIFASSGPDFALAARAATAALHEQINQTLYDA